MSKNTIKGRTQRPVKGVAVVGGITIDIEGFPHSELKAYDSNPGIIKISYGGVGRNITENLARLSLPVTFFSAVGDDFMGHNAKRNLEELGVDVSKVLVLDGENTAMYLSILNDFGDMELGLCNMDVLEKISLSSIENILDLLKDKDMVCLDTNLSEEVLDFLTKELKGIPLFLDTVSVTKAPRAKDLIGRFHTIKPNRIEAEALLGEEILSEKALKKAGEYFIGQGVKRVFISLGSGGVYYKDDKKEAIINPQPSELKSATGAGDAFSAAAILGHIEGWDIEETARIAMENSRIAMESQSAVNPKLSRGYLMERMGKKGNDK